MTTRELSPEEGYALWASNYPPCAHNAVMRAEERAMLGWLPASLHGRRVIDAGCGSGRYSLHARQRGATVFGVDASLEMLQVAAGHDLRVAVGSLTHLPIASGWADLVLCGLTLGHIPALPQALMELGRVLRDAGTALCSDFHPVGHALGWQRSFTLECQRYAVRYVAHQYSDWHRACRMAGLTIEEVAEPRLDLADIPQDAHFDPRALELPVAIAFKLRKGRG
ncbi:MAG TPA: class I SAM-dependent methyltransferase [Steroidobacteraceae bacterium]|jgi:malonyl-CoA O-methyltransferase|nr:class I SAM-dependent methyltransferase [Steroidobacteraceae bacterium]